MSKLAIDKILLDKLELVNVHNYKNVKLLEIVLQCKSLNELYMVQVDIYNHLLECEKNIIEKFGDS